MVRLLTSLLVLSLFAPASAVAADWEERLSVALADGWATRAEAWTQLQNQQPRRTRAGTLRFMGPHYNSPETLPLALARLAHGKDPEAVRAALADVVARFSDDWGDALVELLAEETGASVRAVLVYGLRWVDADSAAAGFTLALDDLDPTVRAEAARVAAKRTDGASVAPGLVVLLGDQDASVRAAVASTLGTLGVMESAPALVSMLSDADPSVRLHSLRALDRIDTTLLSAPTLRTLTADPDQRVSRAADRLLRR